MSKRSSRQNAAANAAAAARKGQDNTGILTIDPVMEPQFENGQYREYLVTTALPLLSKKRNVTSKEYLLVAGLLVCAFYVRCSNLAYPNSVVFDEVHFGGFARKYILGQFFMDVHPPLTKMLFGAAGLFGGFKGDFDFKAIGNEFPDTTPYVTMRYFPALMGVGTILLCYLTLRNSGCRPIVCLITSAALMLENANVTISRYILLDSPLLFFIASAIYAFKKFEVQVPFSFGWYKCLVGCGIALGLAVSSKWVGLFTIAWVGVCCVYQLWFIIGDLSLNCKKVAKHFVVRGSLLLGIPIFLYLLFFSVHFKLLANEGDGSAFMSSAFRASLNGNAIPRDITANVGFGSAVTIRHLETQGGYLHSHNHFYPAGSKQQQITLYPHLDSNNDWIIEPYNETMPDSFVPITDGMKIRLKHANTGRRLHSHDEKAPVSERDWQKEISCYGFDGFDGDANDDFFIEIVERKSAPGEAQSSVRALQTVFRLRHVMTGHYVFSSAVKLPDWGFEQQEVTAASQGYRPLTYWYIETNRNTRVNSTIEEIVNYPVLSFFDKVTELHKRMWKINQGLTDHHNWQSSPHEWPLLLRGINYWVKDHRQVYFLGNAVVWWASSAAIVTFAIHALFSIVRWQTGARVAGNKHVFNFNSQVFLYTVGWALHYFPFFIMGRQLFLHHYIPAIYFAILALGHFFDILVSYLTARYKMLNKVSYGALGLFLTFALLFYVQYSSLIYGTPWTREKCEASKAIGTWDFDCNAFLNNINEYSTLLTTATQTPIPEDPAAPSDALEAKEAKETPQAAQKKVAKEEEHQSEAENAEEPKSDEKVEELVPPLAADIEETK